MSGGAPEAGELPANGSRGSLAAARAPHEWTSASCTPGATLWAPPRAWSTLRNIYLGGFSRETKNLWVSSRFLLVRSKQQFICLSTSKEISCQVCWGHFQAGNGSNRGTSQETSTLKHQSGFIHTAGGGGARRPLAPGHPPLPSPGCSRCPWPWGAARRLGRNPKIISRVIGVLLASVAPPPAPGFCKSPVEAELCKEPGQSPASIGKGEINKTLGPEAGRPGTRTEEGRGELLALPSVPQLLFNSQSGARRC